MKALRMHLRSNGQTFVQRQYDERPLLLMTQQQQPALGTGSRLVLTKKLCLWLGILLLQLCFIGSYWLMQNDISGNDESAEDTLQKVVDKVNFISRFQSAGRQRLVQAPPKQPPSNVNQFHDDFTTRLLNINRSDAELAMAFSGAEEQLWCFNEGTSNDTHLLLPAEEQSPSLDFEQCPCKSGWHGKDCGQPEVIWRALMTNRLLSLPLRKHERNHENPPPEPHRLIAFIEGNFLNLDMLELQLQSLVKVVDFYMIWCKHRESKPKDQAALQKRLRETLKGRRLYSLYQCTESMPANCTRLQAFQRMRDSTDFTIEPTDLLLQLQEQVVISTPALKYFKYYAEGPLTNIGFRLKHNVYGYFWQHPEQTHLNGRLSSFTHSEMQQRSDPGSSIPASSTQVVIGDLNHFGGWYCEYCLQPNELIAQLQLTNVSSFAHSVVQFPNATRHHNIDVNYIQKLIANGEHLAGKTKQLTKVRHSSDDPYYAPAYAQQQNWKYGSFLVNLYEVLNEESEEELYGD